jgi:hypothetical protein
MQASNARVQEDGLFARLTIDNQEHELDLDLLILLYSDKCAETVEQMKLHSAGFSEIHLSDGHYDIWVSDELRNIVLSDKLSDLMRAIEPVFKEMHKRYLAL